MKDRDVFYLQYFDYLYTLIMNGVIDTTAPYVNIFICYGQRLKYLFLMHSTPFPKKCLIPKLASSRYAGG